MFRECPQCGHGYWTDCARSRARHGTVHARWRKVHVPKPDPRIAELAVSGDIIIDRSSPRWLHKRVYEIARALQRDRRFDFVQWTETGDPSWTGWRNHARATLFVEPGGVVIGACSFSRHDWNNVPPAWIMCFAWLAPAWRRQGHLSRRWPTFRERYGNFLLDGPLSEAAQALAAKVGWAPINRHDFEYSIWAPRECVDAIRQHIDRVTPREEHVPLCPSPIAST
jgi:hypothetical protein